MTEVMISAHGYAITAPQLSEAQMQTRAHRDAMRAIARDIPDPAEYARLLPLHFVVALLGAKSASSGGQEREMGLRVAIDAGRLLQPFGLVEAKTSGRYLTAFGLAVRRALVAEDA